MEITPVTLILVGVISVVLGFLASNLLNTLQDEGAGSIENDDQAPPGGRKGRYTPITRLWRERSKGGLVVEIDGKSMVDSSPLDASQRERLEAVARDLRIFLGMGLAPSGRGSAHPNTGSGQPGLTEGASPAAAGEASIWATSGEELESDLRRALGQETASRPVRQTMPASTSTAAGTPARKQITAKPPVEKTAEEAAMPSAGSRSIVLQIEDILQDMLAGSPMAQRDIHLTEDPVRGVIVQVGGNHYEGIESVPDSEVKTIIRAAVEAWEQAQ